jgi:hypothetical protein
MVVRDVYLGSDYPTLICELGWPLLLSEALQIHDIHFRFEKCSEARLRAISQQPEHPHELLLLPSLSPQHPELFAHWNRCVLLLGKPAPGIRLPFACFDLAATVRHATLTMLRHGMGTIHLVIGQTGATAFQGAATEFRAVRASGSPASAEGRGFSIPLELEGMVQGVQRVAAQVEPRHGVIIKWPVPIAPILTALLSRGTGSAGASAGQRCCPQSRFGQSLSITEPLSVSDGGFRESRHPRCTPLLRGGRSSTRTANPRRRTSRATARRGSWFVCRDEELLLPNEERLNRR